MKKVIKILKWIGLSILVILSALSIFLLYGRRKKYDAIPEYPQDEIDYIRERQRKAKQEYQEALDILDRLKAKRDAI